MARIMMVDNDKVESMSGFVVLYYDENGNVEYVIDDCIEDDRINSNDGIKSMIADETLYAPYDEDYLDIADSLAECVLIMLGKVEHIERANSVIRPVQL